MKGRLRFSVFLGVFLTLFFSERVSAQEDSTSIALNIFPNPSRGIFYITTINNESYQSQIFDMDGSLVKNIRLNSGLNYVSLDVPAGIYLLIVRKEDIQEQFKLIIK